MLSSSVRSSYFFVRLSFFTLTIKRVIFNLLLHAKVEGRGGSLLLIHSVRIPQVSSPIWRCEKYFSLVTELRICFFLLYLFLFHSASPFLLNFVFQLTLLMSGAYENVSTEVQYGKSWSLHKPQAIKIKLIGN